MRIQPEQYLAYQTKIKDLPLGPKEKITTFDRNGRKITVEWLNVVPGASFTMFSLFLAVQTVSETALYLPMSVCSYDSKSKE